MSSQGPANERLQSLVDRAWRFAHPFSRRFIEPEGNFVSVTPNRMSMHLPCGRMTSRNVPLVITDGKADIGSESISVQDASFLVNLDFVVLDDVIFLGPLIYQYFIGEPSGLDEAERFFDWIEKCDQPQLLATVLSNFDVEISEESRLQNYVPERVQNTKLWWSERCLHYLSSYCKERLPSGDEEARDLARALADLKEEDLLQEWISASQPRVSHYLDLTQVDSLGEFEVVIDQSRLHDLYAAAG